MNRPLAGLGPANPGRAGLAALALACLAASAAAQSVVEVGANGYACTSDGLGFADGATTGTVTFDYDATGALLRVAVANTSPTAASEPLITHVWFSAPAGTVTRATLLGQTATGKHPFSLTFDADAAKGHARAGCFGSFAFELAVSDLRDAIASAGADWFGGSPKTALAGPVAFTLQLEGPAVHGLASEAFAAATSRGGARDVNVALEFAHRGSDADSIAGNGDHCRTAVFLRGTPRIGEHIDICVAGSNSCSAYLLASAVPGPVTIFGFTLPIGLPLIDAFPLGSFVEGVYELSLPVEIPNQLALVGLSFYFANMTHPWGLPDEIGFSPAFTITVQ